jgi:cytochrome c
MHGVWRTLVAGALFLQCCGVMAATPQSGLKGDPKNGEQVYARCMACHSLTENRIGPSHCGVFGRRAGTVAGFDYSPAMRRAKIVWSEKTLDRFLTDPMKYVPGTAMVFAGVPDGKERADVIAWLKEAGAGSTTCQPNAKR